MKAAGYTRVSTAQQAKSKKDGFDRQLQQITQFATTHNYEIHPDHIYREQYNGNEMARPVFNEMLLDMQTQKPPITVILVESMDRFSRNAIKGLNFLMELLMQEIDIIDCSTGESMREMVNGHPMQEFLVQIRFLLAHYDRRTIIHHQPVP